MNEIRLGIQRAIDKLVNRFGNEGDVIRELRVVLAHIDKGNAVPAATIPPPEEKEPEGTPAPSSESKPEAEPRPRARRSMGRKK